MNGTERIYFPICDNKTRTMIREDTELRNETFFSTDQNAKRKQSSMLRTGKFYFWVIKIGG
mgnify:FL=1